MRCVGLLAGNYLRDQRWVLVAMAVYSAVMGAVFTIGSDALTTEDIRFYMDQQLWFALVFSTFLSTAAINADLRSRRILALLSKAVYRWQYLGGILLGVSVVLATYCGVTALVASVLSSRMGGQLEQHLLHAEVILIAGVALACVGLMFGTFMHPLAASLLTFAALFLPAGITKTVPVLALISPAGVLAVAAADLGSAKHLTTLVLATVAQGVLAFGLGNIIFERRDLATAIE